MVCPATSAWDLHRKFPEAEFVIVEDSGHRCAIPDPGGVTVLNSIALTPPGSNPTTYSGHSAMEPGTLAELVAATDRFADL